LFHQHQLANRISIQGEIMTDLVRTTLTDGVYQIEINRPEKKNALTADMYSVLADGLVEAEADPKVRVILIHGTQGNFTAGNDLNDFMRNPPVSENAPVFRFINGFANLQKPFVAAVEGVAVGVGTTMLLHCDLVYASTSARFSMPFTNLGLTPEAGSSILLAQRVGHVRAAEMLMLGEPFGADDALTAKLVNAVVPDGQVIAHALARCQKLAAQPAAAIRITKDLMTKNQRPLVREVMRHESMIFGQQLGSPEAKEAFTAFFEKRKPDFSKFD
jgi:enoyl-CoA hydratase/carnithine racemase